MMRQRRFEIRLSDAEFAAIKTNADGTGMSMAAYLRRCGLKRKINSRIDQQSISDLLAVNADLARLGNLMKLAITELSDETESPIAELLITDAQEQLGKIDQLRHLLKAKIIGLNAG